MMFVDGIGPFSGESQGAFQGLDLSELVYIGAVPDFGEIHPSAGFSNGFKGMSPLWGLSISAKVAQT
jgi:hypothetical protein